MTAKISNLLDHKSAKISLVALLLISLLATFFGVGTLFAPTYASWRDGVNVKATNITAGDLQVMGGDSKAFFVPGDIDSKDTKPGSNPWQNLGDSCIDGYKQVNVDKDALGTTVHFGSYDRAVTGIIPIKLVNYGDNIESGLKAVGDITFEGNGEKVFKVSDFQIVDDHSNPVTTLKNLGPDAKDYYVRFTIRRTDTSALQDPATAKIKNVNVSLEQVKIESNENNKVDTDKTDTKTDAGEDETKPAEKPASVEAK